MREKGKCDSGPLLSILIGRWALDVRRWFPKQQTLNASLSTSNSDYAHHSHRLSRPRVILVFLVGAHMGGIEKVLRRPRRVPVEDRAHGPSRFADFARAGAMVLPAQWNNDAVAIHAEYRLV